MKEHPQAPVPSPESSWNFSGELLRTARIRRLADCLKRYGVCTAEGQKIGHPSIQGILSVCGQQSIGQRHDFNAYIFV